MKYLVYTDGAYNKVIDKMSYGYFIRTRKSYIGMGEGSTQGGNNGIAELLAVGLAIQYLLDSSSMLPEDTVELLTDSQYVIDLFTKVLKGINIPITNSEVGNVVKLVRTLSSKCTLTLSKTKSHHKDRNGNKLADRLAKYALQKSILEGE